MLPGAEGKCFAGDGPEELSVGEARLTAEAIVSAKRCSIVLSCSPKALGRAENTSSNPITFAPERTGAASIDRIQRARQLSRSTRSSVSVSSQRNILTVRTHSPEKPEPTCKVAPTGGALGPALARQAMALASLSLSLSLSLSSLSFSLPASAIAAPEARSKE